METRSSLTETVTKAVVVTAEGYETTITVDVYAVSMDSKFKIGTSLRAFVDDLFAGQNYDVDITVPYHPMLKNK